MTQNNPDDLRVQIRDHHLMDEDILIGRLSEQAGLSAARRAKAAAHATAMVQALRDEDQPGLMEVFLAEYGLSTDEGVALMCLAEALLRVPDAETVDDLIEDKIAPSSWGEHLGRSSSSLVNASTWALMLTGKVLDNDASTGIAATLHSAVKRLGEPVIRLAVTQAIKEMGNQFILGETIDEAIGRARELERLGYSYSYDMLGEAALTAEAAATFHAAYLTAIEKLAARAGSDDIRDNPGISIKLSALHPRYELGQRDRVMTELSARILELALAAKAARLGLNIDAEEADRLDLSLDLIETVLADPRLAGWDGFGVVVQAYGKRAGPVLDWLYATAGKLDRRIMVRLVKGAYWDSEIKWAQVAGLSDFPVFTRKAATDISYLCCAAKLSGMTDRIYPQFATHNAHTVAAVLDLMADKECFEFQRLHGMGEALHRHVHIAERTRCRIYAPVGAHRDLLAYLVRRLLENGANSSFVNQIVDTRLTPAEITQDPFETYAEREGRLAGQVLKPADLFQPARRNSHGWDLHNRRDLTDIDAGRAAFKHHRWRAGPIIAAPTARTDIRAISNPAKPDDYVGDVIEATEADVAAAIDAARPWTVGAEERAETLNRAADLYEENFGEIFAVLTREAGKTPDDAIAELREAVDFLRYYGSRIDSLGGQRARGLFACISPWNFPLAIFTGQLAAALAAGNGVLAKPAEQTPLTAAVAVRLLHVVGVPPTALQLLPGDGPTVGGPLTRDPRIAGICFTGSTDTAQIIHRAMADHLAPNAPLIAETGGLNAMIVDSTALPEQAVKDIIASAFQSAGQRCSALRLLYLQDDIADGFLDLLFGAMEELVVDDPWTFSTDIGPLIDADARKDVNGHVEIAKSEGRLLKQLAIPANGHFVGPAVIELGGIADLAREVFGPILHVARFDAARIDDVVDEINARGFGLTFGLHSRIDDRIEQITQRLKVGNMYINRNQIGAVVGSQPFGGEGLSGTGPKAGGPRYLPKFSVAPDAADEIEVEMTPIADLSDIQSELSKLSPNSHPSSSEELPGPTGESNRLSTYPRGTVLCLGPDAESALEQRRQAEALGCAVLAVAPGLTDEQGIARYLDREHLTSLMGFDAVALWSNPDDQRAARRALAARDGPILTLLTERDLAPDLHLERHVCIDTTASGGNASLLAAVS